MIKNAKMSLLICVILILSLTLPMFGCSCGCKKNPTEQPPSNVVKDTDVEFISGGKSDYKIVVSQNASKADLYAATELSAYTFNASGCKLQVINDSEATFSPNNKFLSVGNTTLLTASGLKGIDAVTLNNDGFKIKTFGNLTIIAGAGKDGTLLGVYEFLKYNFNYKFYAVDETVFTAVEKAMHKDFSVVEIPDFATRVTYYNSILSDETARPRLRGHNNIDWGIFAHAFFKILPTEKYLIPHPDWYSKDEEQLCVTNEEMRAEFMVQLKNWILDTPDQVYYSVGQEDFPTYCDCPVCSASHAKYLKSGTMMRFVNSIARDIKTWQTTPEWLNSKNPNRQIWISTFAYQETRPSPTNYDKGSNTFTPVDPSVIAEDNVLVQYAPLEACFSHALDAECNSTFMAALRGWQAITKNFAIWTYSTNFSDFFLNFNNFSSIAADYKIFKDIGTKVLMDQGVGETLSSPLQNMRVYISSQLMWDVDQDFNKLAYDFINNYYKDVAPELTEYYNLTREHYASIDDNHIAAGNGPFHTYIYNDLYGETVDQPKYWSKRCLEQFNEIFDRALVKVNNIADLKLRRTLYARVLAESLSPRYHLLDFYRDTYPKEELIALIDQFETDAAFCSMTMYGEARPIGDKLTEWRKKLV